MHTVRQTSNSSITLSKITPTTGTASRRETYALSDKGSGYFLVVVTVKDTNKTGRKKVVPWTSGFNKPYNLLPDTDENRIRSIRALHKRLYGDLGGFTMMNEMGSLVVDGNDVLPGLYKLLQTLSQNGQTKAFIQLTACTQDDGCDSEICVSSTMQALSSFSDMIKEKETKMSCVEGTRGETGKTAFFAVDSLYPGWMLHLEQADPGSLYGTESGAIGFEPTLLSLDLGSGEDVHALRLGKIAVRDSGLVLGVKEALSDSRRSASDCYPPDADGPLRTCENMVRAATQGLSEVDKA